MVEIIFHSPITYTPAKKEHEVLLFAIGNLLIYYLHGAIRRRDNCVKVNSLGFLCNLNLVSVEKLLLESQ